MKKFRKLILVLMSFMMIATFNQVKVNAAWVHDQIGWWNTEGTSWSIGWRLINGKWYYFYPSSYMAQNTYIDGYYVNSSGEWVENQPTAVTSTQNDLNTDNSKDNVTAIDNSVNAEVEDTSDIVNKDKNEKNNEEVDEDDDYDDDEDDEDDEEDDDDFYDYSRKNSSEEYVSGYYRKNGTYVHGYWRTKRDKTTSNNYTHKGNINPHNGKKGYKK